MQRIFVALFFVSLTLSAGCSRRPTVVRGGVGPEGQPGKPGPTGPQGPAGTVGETGQVGTQGPAGEAGTDGQNGAPGVAGPQGPAGEAGLDGQDGAAGPAGPSPTAFFATLQASRTYSPSTWQDGTVQVGAGTYLFPTEVQAQGNAGTGWLSATLGSYRLCYQGTAPNSNQVSGTFRFKGYVPAAVECSAQTPTPSQSVLFVAQQSTLTVSVNGGGCSQQCVATSVGLSVAGFGVPAPAAAGGQ